MTPYSVDHCAIKPLLRGFDTVQCCYYLLPSSADGIDFDRLAAQRESLRHAGIEAPEPITLGNRDFLLASHGSRSGYPFVISDADYRIECGPHNNPPFFVTFRSEALWRLSIWQLHQNFIDWAANLGYRAVKPETMTRLDFCFDYALPTVDFEWDQFLTLSTKDSQHREDGKAQTFTFGKGDVVLRVYDKVVEIKQQSAKVWFYDLWGQDHDVWRIEWQVRKEVLRRFGIRTFDDVRNRLGALLQYLATEHDTLRVPTADSNQSRWPLHPLWTDLQRQIAEFEVSDASLGADPSVVLAYRMMQMATSMYGYLKRIGAVHAVQRNKTVVSEREALEVFERLIRQVHDPLTWYADVDKRIRAIRLGEW